MGPFAFWNRNPATKKNRLVKAVASKQINNRLWLAYKYIPSLDGPPDADYPITTRNDVTINELWMGKQADIYFGSPTKENIATRVNVIDALKTLEIVKIEQVIHFKGSALLLFDQTYRLK